MPRFDGNQFNTTGGTVRIDTRTPLARNTHGAGMSIGGDTVNININAAGMDAQTIAQAVGAELDRRERTKQARARSNYNDR